MVYLSLDWKLVGKQFLKRIKPIGKRLESDWNIIGKHLKIFGAVYGKLEQCVATFGNLWYFLHLIGNCLESNFKENKAEWKAIGERLEYYWKAIENFWHFLEQFLAN